MEIEYSQLEQQLRDAGVEADSAEVQGLVCGLFCTDETQVEAMLLGELFPTGPGEDAAAQDCVDALMRVVQDTRRSISGGETGYALLLPPENEPILQRATALRNWCVGFLYGLGLAGEAPEKRLSPESREALADLTEITRLDLDEMGDSEEDESALMEITEYIWVAATLIHDEVAPANRS